jgi:hypothetical protein
MKFNGNCHNCGKHGHTARECNAEWSNYAFKPPRKDNDAGPSVEPRALVSNIDG